MSMRLTGPPNCAAAVSVHGDSHHAHRTRRVIRWRAGGERLAKRTRRKLRTWRESLDWRTWRTWRTSEKILVAAVAAPFVFLIWSAWRSSVYDAEMEQRVRSSFLPVACEIQSSSWGELRGRRPSDTISYVVHVEYTYSVDGQAYSSRRIKPRPRMIHTRQDAQAFVIRYPARAGRTCYYDPSNPSLAFLEQ
jgi:hypothetical protein